MKYYESVLLYPFWYNVLIVVFMSTSSIIIFPPYGELYLLRFQYNEWFKTGITKWEFSPPKVGIFIMPFTPDILSCDFGADENDDWTDPKVWKKANHSLGITVSIDKVQAACESAKQNPGEENAFRQLRLNQWVKQAVRWMPMEKWDDCAFPVNEDDLEGRVCYGGLDLSSTTDITAFVLVFPPRAEEDKFAVLPYFWIPEDTLELRARRDHVPYDVWERQGYLQTTEGNVVHYGYIEKFIERLGERFNIREIAFDRWVLFRWCRIWEVWDLQ